MNVKAVKFNLEDKPEFFTELRKNVNNYFKENNISKHANFNMKFKTVFMLTLYFTPLVLMVVGEVTQLWPSMIMWAIMGFGMSGIGLSVMHDANHGSYSNNKKVNYALGYLLNFIGGYPLNWKIQHNVLHHSFTNVHGYDEDIDKKGIIRFSPTQPRNGIHKFQVLYAPFLYGILTIYWLIAKDFDQIIRYNKSDLLKAQGITFARAIFEIIFNKIWYLALFLALPIIATDLIWWQVLLGFLLMHFISGLILALIFQSAHVLEETSFYKVDDKSSLENNWAIHQLKTTSNFANGSIFFSWFIGGLNYQIEHHLFPNICHVHYRNIASIVKETAKKHNVPYYQHKTFFGALKSHFTMLYKLGKGSVNTKLATA
ncbi:MAG: acyl-CoA desaturase [Cyclobacteriaceae bacterium]|nr:acyl-CoA desaturase [Cyclobacteriaceae bacterium]